MCKMRDLIYLLFLSAMIAPNLALNILVFMPQCAVSHFRVFAELFKTLSVKENNVTVISYFPLKTSISNYTDVTITPSKKILKGVSKVGEIPVKDFSRFRMYADISTLVHFSNVTCNTLSRDPEIQRLFTQNDVYDVVLTEIFNTECHLEFLKAIKYKGPVIGLSTCIPLPWMNPMFGAPDNPAYIPNIFLDHSDHMSFFERVENTVTLVIHKLIYELYMKRQGNELSIKYLGEDIVTEQDLDYRVSILLMNTHFTFSRPRPLPPNVIEIGGIHITEEKPLPTDLKKYIEESPHGVVYMSMGSMLKGVSFPQEKRIKFLKAFSRIKQRVIWKWESDTMEGKPDNVMLHKWTPQKDLLCHPNVKAFVSHGGLLGTLEAVHCGIPMVVLPQFGDQHTNAAMVQENGFGVRMLLSEATEESILENLKTVMSEKYTKQAKEMSRRFKDRPLPPMETALYWINYVAKHKGAEFMRTSAVDMPFYQYYLLDVIGFIIVVLLSSLFVIYKLLRIVLQCVLGKTPKQKVKTN